MLCQRLTVKGLEIKNKRMKKMFYLFLRYYKSMFIRVNFKVLLKSLRKTLIFQYNVVIIYLDYVFIYHLKN